jgi:hypothetical protein
MSDYSKGERLLLSASLAMPLPVNNRNFVPSAYINLARPAYFLQPHFLTNEFLDERIENLAQNIKT